MLKISQEVKEFFPKMKGKTYDLLLQAADGGKKIGQQ